MKLIKKLNKEFLVIVIILAIASFFRFYKLDEYMLFLGDQGRDAIIIKQILTQGDIPFIGPPSSVGNIYNGPLYYYMMVIPMAIFWLNPVAAAGMVALIGVATVGLVYYLSREWFGKQAALVASLLYALSPVAISYSNFSWNPNPAPFFATLGILGLFKAHRTQNFGWLVLTGVALAFAVQMHYLALILLPIYLILWFLKLLSRQALKLRNFWWGSFVAVLVFFILMSPLVFFDFKHDFLNLRAFNELFFSKGTSSVGLNPLASLNKIIPIYQYNLVERGISGDNKLLVWVISILIISPLVITLWQLVIRKQKLEWPFLALGIWLGAGLLGLSLYKQELYDHYTLFLNPAPVILFGSVVHFINKVNSKRISQFLRGVFFLILLMLIIINLQRSPFLKDPNRQLQKTQEIAKFVIDESADKPFNFALLAERNYDAAYQFVLDQMGEKPGQLPMEKTDQLYVVCEDQICKPVGHPKYEIAAFGWAKEEWMQEIDGIKVFKLVHNPDQPK